MSLLNLYKFGPLVLDHTEREMPESVQKRHPTSSSVYADLICHIQPQLIRLLADHEFLMQIDISKQIHVSDDISEVILQQHHLDRKVYETNLWRFQDFEYDTLCIMEILHDFVIFLQTSVQTETTKLQNALAQIAEGIKKSHFSDNAANLTHFGDLYGKHRETLGLTDHTVLNATTALHPWKFTQTFHAFSHISWMIRLMDAIATHIVTMHQKLIKKITNKNATNAFEFYIHLTAKIEIVHSAIQSRSADVRNICNHNAADIFKNLIQLHQKFTCLAIAQQNDIDMDKNEILKIFHLRAHEFQDQYGTEIMHLCVNQANAFAKREGTLLMFTGTRSVHEDLQRHSFCNFDQKILNGHITACKDKIDGIINGDYRLKTFDQLYMHFFYPEHQNNLHNKTFVDEVVACMHKNKVLEHIRNSSWTCIDIVL